MQPVIVSCETITTFKLEEFFLFHYKTYKPQKCIILIKLKKLENIFGLTKVLAR